jgi:hypothetical protein
MGDWLIAKINVPITAYHINEGFESMIPVFELRKIPRVTDVNKLTPCRAAVTMCTTSLNASYKNLECRPHSLLMTIQCVRKFRRM